MAYIGKEPSFGAFEKDIFTGDGSTTQFTLTHTVASATSIIVSLGGDNIAPSKLENLLTLSSDIEQACVFGEQKNYIAALIILSLDSKATKEQIDLYIEKMNADLTQPEKIKRYHIIDEPFTIENNLMTPTMKVRRHEVEKKYTEVINGMF